MPSFPAFIARTRAFGRRGAALLLPALVLTACQNFQPPEALDPPNPATDTLVVAPQDPQVVPGDTVQFTAPTQTINGTPATGPVTWTTTGGSIDTTGRFTTTTTGLYTVTADRGGKKGRSKVRVTASSVSLLGVELTPASVTVAPAATQQFSAVARMSDGSTQSVGVTYVATGGTITGTGMYAAGSIAGSFRVIAVEAGGKADTSAVTVTAVPPTLVGVEMTPVTVTLQTGATQQFSVAGRLSDGSSQSVAVTYVATGGTITGAGLYSAGATAGAFRVIAVQQGGTLADTAAVTITAAAPTLTQVVLVPATAALNTGATQQFSASGRLSDGSTSPVTVTYTATGGSISTGGLYTAGTTAGTFRVIAVQQGGTLADTSTVTLSVPAPTLTQVILTPATAALNTGATQQFSASGRLSDGSTSPVTVTYSATGGTMTTGGLYTAGSTAGTFRVIATQQGGTLADTAAVTLTATAPTLTQVILTPATASLQTGATQQFSASGRLSDGSTSAVTVTYSATGGTMTTGGLYTAGSTAGTFRVIATQQGGTLADTSAVTLTVPAPALTQVVLTPGTAALNTGATQQFSASGRLSDGSTSAVTVTYGATGGTVTTGGMYSAGATAGTFRVIATQQGGTLADTSAVTLTAAPVATVSVSPASASVVAGGTQQLTATLRDAAGSTLTGRTVTWSSGNGAVATVSASGVVAAVTAGSASITAASEGQQGTSAVTVTTPPPPGAVWQNMPAGWQIVTEHDMSSVVRGTALRGPGMWMPGSQSGSGIPDPVAVSNETGELASAPGALRQRNTDANPGGAIGQYYVTDPSPSRRAYVGFTFRTDSDWRGYEFYNAKLLWFITSGGYNPVLKVPYGPIGGPWNVQVTSEVVSSGTVNYDGASGSWPTPQQWHQVEIYVDISGASGTGIYRVWIDGVLRLNATNGIHSGNPIEALDWQVYFGGPQGGSDPATPSDFLIGHFIWAKP